MPRNSRLEHWPISEICSQVRNFYIYLKNKNDFLLFFSCTSLNETTSTSHQIDKIVQEYDSNAIASTSKDVSCVTLSHSEFFQNSRIFFRPQEIHARALGGGGDLLTFANVYDVPYSVHILGAHQPFMSDVSITILT